MKTKLLFLLLFFVGLISCEKDKTPDNISEYPVEVSFEKYDITEASCNWKVFEHDKVIAINSDKELQDYMVCTDAVYPQINFSEYSLLLAEGVTTSSPAEVLETRLTQTLENEYVLYVKVRRGDALTLGYWNIGITTQKLFENAVITLDVEQIDN